MLYVYNLYQLIAKNPYVKPRTQKLETNIERPLKIVHGTPSEDSYIEKK